MPDMDGMMEFDGPEGMMLEPQMRIMRERMEPLMKERMEPLMKERMEPLMREQLQPLMRERWNDLPSRIQIRAPMRIRTLNQPGVRTRTYRVDASDMQPVSPDLIRELVATTILNAQSALKQLAADGIA
jgi:hypothetical protein